MASAGVEATLPPVTWDPRIDTVTGRPRTPNDQYTELREEQIKRINKEKSPHFHTIAPPSNHHTTAITKPGGRQFIDRHCRVSNYYFNRARILKVYFHQLILINYYW